MRSVLLSYLHILFYLTYIFISSYRADTRLVLCFLDGMNGWGVVLISLAQIRSVLSNE